MPIAITDKGRIAYAYVDRLVGVTEDCFRLTGAVNSQFDRRLVSSSGKVEAPGCMPAIA